MRKTVAPSDYRVLSHLLKRYGKDAVLAEIERVAQVEALIKERDALFTLVADPADWKAPIEAFISYGWNIPAEVMMDAIQHFTGAGVSITQETYGYTVKSDGYRKGPCGP